jgi:riboflavin kinase/FMN adenylyltransferase
MEVYPSLAAATGGPLAGCAVCLGNFDGAHLGHQALFALARKHGRAAALTFEPHPGKVLQPHLAPRLITTLPRKLELLEASGLAAVIVQPFTPDFARTPPAAFEEALLDGVRPGLVVVGADYSYGARRAGTVATLASAAAGRGARLEVVPPVTLEGAVVSSSQVREFLLEGRVEAAARMLGRPFDLEGPVVKGDGRGRTIGVPTANVATLNELQPAPGVYAVRARVGGGGPWLDGVANLGVRPTFGGGEPSLEVHLLDRDQDLYGAVLRVRFLARLRAERRFGSAAELVAQIALDAQAAREELALTAVGAQS